MGANNLGPAWLILENGEVLEGEHLGADGTAYGELVFNTGMTGYQESLTDPSYNGQVLMFTYPMIGNYGVNEQDWESDRVWPRGVVMREWCREPDHRGSTKTIHQWLAEQNVPAISGIDTRKLTLETREQGCLRCFITNDESQVQELLAKVADMPSVEVDNLAGEASVQAPRNLQFNPRGELVEGELGDGKYRVAVIDTGIKRNILRNLVRRFDVVQFPWNATADAIDAAGPDAVFLANGPGDPSHPEIIDQTVATIAAVAQKYPVFGICYGNQLVSLAFGASTSKMKFGHRGANIPVRHEGTNDVRITSQNHGFAVDAQSIAGTGLKIWERCPNDDTVEGVMHESLPVFTTQYHPEACPGPWDSGQLFDAFSALIEQVKSGTFVPGEIPVTQPRAHPITN